MVIGHSQNHSCSSALSFFTTTACMLSCSVVSNSATPWNSLPGSSVHRISQARILEWVAISFSRGSSRRRDQSTSPVVPALAGGFFFLSFFLSFFFFTTEPPGKPHNSFWTLIQVVNCFLGEAPAISRMLTITKILEENSKYVIQSLPYKPWGESRQRPIDSK